MQLALDLNTKELTCGALILSPGDIVMVSSLSLSCLCVSDKGVEWRNNASLYVCFVSTACDNPVVGGLDNEYHFKR